MYPWQVLQTFTDGAGWLEKKSVHCRSIWERGRGGRLREGACFTGSARGGAKRLREGKRAEGVQSGRKWFAPLFYGLSCNSSVCTLHRTVTPMQSQHATWKVTVCDLLTPSCAAYQVCSIPGLSTNLKRNIAPTAEPCSTVHAEPSQQSTEQSINCKVKSANWTFYSVAQCRLWR